MTELRQCADHTDIRAEDFFQWLDKASQCESFAGADRSLFITVKQTNGPADVYRPIDQPLLEDTVGFTRRAAQQNLIGIPALFDIRIVCAIEIGLTSEMHGQTCRRR
jgi:hypothetical protein